MKLPQHEEKQQFVPKNSSNNRTPKKNNSKRLAAAGASLMLFGAAGALAVYSSSSSSPMETQNLSAMQTSVVDTEVVGDALYTPPYDSFDYNRDGTVSNTEYRQHLQILHDDTLKKVITSTQLTDDQKQTLKERLATNLQKQSACVTKLANADREANGAIYEERFPLFYQMIQEFCPVDDTLIPTEFLPIDKEPTPVTAAPVAPITTVAPIIPINGNNNQPMVGTPEPIVATSAPAKKQAPALTSDTWKQLDGALVQVSFDGKSLCGVNRKGDIWCAEKKIAGKGTNWQQHQGSLAQVTVYGEHMVGVSRNGAISYKANDPKVTFFRRIEGSLKQVTTDGKQICGVNANDDIFCADDDIFNKPNWRQIPGKLKDVELQNGRLVGVNSNNEIYIGNAYGEPNWLRLPGSLSQVSFDGRLLCGSNAQNDVYCAYDGLTAADPNWWQVDGKMTNVAVNAGVLYGTDAKDGIFRKDF